MPLLYLHGFNSAPASHKVSLLRRHLAALGRASALHVPALEADPAAAVSAAERLVERMLPDPVCVIGSSLGGFYATWLAERYALKAVLINPALRPQRLLDRYLGPQLNPYTGERWELTRRHLEQLDDFEVKAAMHPERFLVLLQTGDEVLDYRVAARMFHAAEVRVFEGGNHAFAGFDILLPDVLAFCGAECWAANEKG